jgi:hypothetical protein
MSVQVSRRPAALAVIAVALVAAGCGGQDSPPPKANATSRVVASVDYAGVQHRHYRYGPILIRPGQNPIVFRPAMQKPHVAGYITRFHPDLVYTDGKKPGVDVLHLHHGVWIMREYPTFAAGEEKTITQFPRGFGYRYDSKDPWVLNYMLHNLTPAKARVYLTWDMDFLPASAPAAAHMKEVRPLWLDVGKGNYPVFDVQRGWGKDGRYTFPEDARGAERRKIGPQQRVRMPADLTLVAAGGHVHPGGLWVDLRSSRGDRTKTIFRSEAKYYEPAGAVSWDASMTFTKPGWRVAVRKGDTLSVSTTYDSSRASWYEVMGIIDPLWYTAAPGAGGRDPFTQRIDWRGVVTHGHLPENDNHGGTVQSGRPDPRTMPAGAQVPAVGIEEFVYALGDLSRTGVPGRPPTIRQGGTLTFHNFDSPKGLDPARSIYHTITGCKSPCNKATGIAYPIADGEATFDSGELGYGPRQATAAANRVEWRTPKTLAPGTYSYFCRVHPFMRGAFRVTPR